MTKPVRIALDAMGGDHGPSVVVPGAALALQRRPDLTFVMAGYRSMIEPLLAHHPKLKAVTTVLHAEVAIRMDDNPSQALRSGRRVSSMWMALDAVKRGDADAALSAGNTGALMAMSKICLRTMPQIERPAIAAMWPTIRGESIVLDVGATIGFDAHHLVDLAIMGSAMARIVFDIERPTVGLLNIGVEEIKGLEEVKAAGRILKEMAPPGLDYHGFVEGDDLGKGTVDVVVTEGFTGNIALKTAEGTAKQIAQYLRDAMGRSLMSKIGCSWDLTASGSRVTAAPTFWAMRAPSKSPTTWSGTSCWARSGTRWRSSRTSARRPSGPRPQWPLRREGGSVHRVIGFGW